MKKFNKWLSKRDKSLYESVKNKPLSEVLGPAGANYPQQQPAMQAQPAQTQKFTGYKNGKYYVDGQLAGGWTDLRPEDMAQSPYKMGSKIRGTAGEFERGRRRFFQSGIEEDDSGKFSEPNQSNQGMQGFTGWKDRKYYVNGQLADGWTDLRPEDANQTMNGLSRTLFRQGVEQDF